MSTVRFEIAWPLPSSVPANGEDSSRKRGFQGAPERSMSAPRA